MEGLKMESLQSMLAFCATMPLPVIGEAAVGTEAKQSLKRGRRGARARLPDIQLSRDAHYA
jgi:hypothetical protein